MAPALLISRMISPRKRSNPVKFLPMECGQVPSGEGRTHFMMQYYAYILMLWQFSYMHGEVHFWTYQNLQLCQLLVSWELCLLQWLLHYISQGDETYGSFLYKSKLR